VLSGVVTNTNFKDFGLTRPGIEPTTYRTRGEHASHYATDAVMKLCVVQIYIRKGFKISKVLLEAVHRRTNNTKKKTKRKAMIDK
jgi:hypothetical protein